MLTKLRICIWLLVILISAVNIRADLGLPRIQAICRITLIDGTKQEGFVVLSKATYHYYRPHGFCFLHEEGVFDLRIFDLEFKPFSPRQVSSYKQGMSRLYFATNTSMNTGAKIEFEFSNEDNLLTRNYSEINQYKLSERIILYLDLPLSLYLPDEPRSEDNVLVVNISEIDKFEFLAYPSKDWLELIENAREKLRIDMMRVEKKGKSWVDYMPPDWYHEILDNEERLRHLLQYFK